MEYNKIVEGIFLTRPNRFIAQVMIDGEEETVHVTSVMLMKKSLKYLNLA